MKVLCPPNFLFYVKPRIMGKWKFYCENCLLSLNGFILDSQIVEQNKLNIVIRQQWLEARVSCNKNVVIYVNSFSSDCTNVNKFGTFYCQALKSFNLLFAQFSHFYIKKDLLFCLNVDDIYEDTMRTYNDPQPYKQVWQHFVALKLHAIVPVKW